MNSWKKWILIPGILMLSFFLSGCDLIHKGAVMTGFAENPYYQEGDTWWDHGDIEEYYFNQIPSELNEIYRELYSRIKNHEDKASLYASVTTEQFWDAYYAVLADHPELFWVGNSIQVEESVLLGKVVGYELTTTVSLENREEMLRQIEAAADECIARIDPEASDYQKIKAVYEYLIDTTEYDSSSPDNQNIQSALLGHASVCAGYSKAFQYILHRMGMFCTYVTGHTIGGGDHGWNIVRIGDNYYHVDVTWGDPVFVNAQEQTSSDLAMNYNYLCCTDEELSRTHISDVSIPLPECWDDSYNYYRIIGAYYEYFDYDTIYNALMDSVWSEEDSISLKFRYCEDYETARYEIFENGLISDAGQYLMRVNGASSWNYRYHADDEFYMITIYW